MDVIKSLVGLISEDRRVHTEVATPTFTGERWEAFKSQFKQACSVNNWNDAEKATRLRCALRGAALSFLYNPGVDEWDYATLEKQMDKRFGNVKADLFLTESTIGFIMQPKEKVYHFADRINESFVQSKLDEGAKSTIGWLALMGGLKKHHRRMREYIQTKLKTRSYAEALELAEQYERSHEAPDDDESTDEYGTPNSALVAAVKEKKEKEDTKKRHAAAHTKADEQIQVLARRTDRRVQAILEANDGTSGTDTSESADATSDDLFSQLEQRLEARVQQAYTETRPNNNVQLKKTKPVPPAGTAHTEKRLDAVLDKVLALETAVEERERNRLAANAKRASRKNGYGGGGGYNNNHQGNYKGGYNNNNNYRGKHRGGRGGYNNYNNNYHGGGYQQNYNPAYNQAVQQPYQPNGYQPPTSQYQQPALPAPTPPAVAPMAIRANHA